MKHFFSYKVLVIFAVLFCKTSLAQASQPLHPIPEQPLAPAFKLKDINGKFHTLDEYRGKVLIINFWATWCPPCRFELPSMERAYQVLKKEGVEFLAIDVGEDEDTIFTFTVDYPVTFPLLMDLDSKVINEYKVIGLPTTYVVDTQGRLVYRAVGTRDWDHAEILKTIRALYKTK